MKTFNLKTVGKAWKVFCIALCFNLIVVSAYSYAFINIQQKNKHTSELLSESATLTAQKENQGATKENVSETVAVRNELDTYFIPQNGVVPFLNLLQSLGTENHLTLKVVSVGIDVAPLSPDILEEVLANLEVTGTWSDVSRFAALVELMPYKVYLNTVNLEKVSDATVSSSKSASAAPSWKGDLTIGVLKLK